MTNQLASLARSDYFYLDAFWRVNLGMYIIIHKNLVIQVAKPRKTEASTWHKSFSELGTPFAGQDICRKPSPDQN